MVSFPRVFHRVDKAMVAPGAGVVRKRFILDFVSKRERIGLAGAICGCASEENLPSLGSASLIFILFFENLRWEDETEDKMNPSA
jgi:hypothetical protein